MTYYAIPDNRIDPNEPFTSKLAYQMRDNMLAIAQQSPGAPSLPLLNREVYAAAGIPAASPWIVPPNVYLFRVTLIGGGGGGGCSYNDGMGVFYPGAGGGSGGYLVAIISATPGDGYDLVIGAGGSAGTAGPGTSDGGNGGDTSITIGTYYLTAFGGVGGQGNVITTAHGGSGGSSVSVPGGDMILLGDALEMRGAPGGHAVAPEVGGNGGSSAISGGGRGGKETAGASSLIAGGGGGGAGTGGVVSLNGGEGAPGLILIEY